MLCLLSYPPNSYLILSLYFYSYRKGGRTIEHSSIRLCRNTHEFQGSKYLYSTQPALNIFISSFIYHHYDAIIDGRIIEHSLISSFEVSALFTARLLSSLSFVIYFFSFLCFLVFILIIDGRTIEHRILILDLPGNKLGIWRLRSIGDLHSPSIIIYYILNG